MSIYDNAQVKGFNPARGEQRPERYPYTGPNYAHFGEPPAGWVYSPRDDKYYRDTATQQQLQQYEEQQGLREKQPKQQGLLSAIAPTAGTLGALYLAKTVGEEAVPFIKDAFGSSVAQTGAQTAAEQVGTQAATQAAADVGAQAASQGAAALPPVTGAEAAPSLFSGIGPMASTAGGAAALGGIAAGTVLGGQAAYDMVRGKKPGLPGRIILGMATGGLSELARPLFGHKSTRETAKKNTQKLMGIAPDDAVYQQYVAGARQAYNAAPVDPSKPFAGKYASWDEYEKAGLQAPDLTHVFGNIETYGPDWARLTEQQRQAVTQENINRGNYYSKKGDVLIKDKKAALDAYNAALGIAQPQPQPTQEGRGGAKGPLVMGQQAPVPKDKLINVVRR